MANFARHGAETTVPGLSTARKRWQKAREGVVSQTFGLPLCLVMSQTSLWFRGRRSLDIVMLRYAESTANC
jgi:hypothetical protein